MKPSPSAVLQMHARRTALGLSLSSSVRFDISSYAYCRTRTRHDLGHYTYENYFLNAMKTSCNTI